MLPRITIEVSKTLEEVVQRVVVLLLRSALQTLLNQLAGEGAAGPLALKGNLVRSLLLCSLLILARRRGIAVRVERTLTLLSRVAELLSLKRTYAPFSSRSSSLCVPDSRTRPLPMTEMQSASLMVERRWVMVMVVRPAAALSRTFCTTPSLCVSSAKVASSRYEDPRRWHVR